MFALSLLYSQDAARQLLYDYLEYIACSADFGPRCLEVSSYALENQEVALSRPDLL